MAVKTGLKYSPEHIWVEINKDKAKVGISEHAAEQLGELLFVDLPEEGASFEKGDIFSEIESSKTNSELALPFAGEVIAVNEELDDSPEKINEGAYDAWIAEFKITDPSTLDDLLSAEAYEATL